MVRDAGTCSLQPEPGDDRLLKAYEQLPPSPSHNTHVRELHWEPGPERVSAHNNSPSTGKVIHTSFWKSEFRFAYVFWITFLWSFYDFFRSLIGLLTSDFGWFLHLKTFCLQWSWWSAVVMMWMSTQVEEWAAAHF